MRRLALAALALWPSLAWGNGRPPATLAIEQRPGVPADLLLGTTFGGLVSHDGGASWRWICEQVAGYASGADPVWRWLADGAIVATTPDGLSVSRDGGCSFTPATGTGGARAVDVEVDPSRAERLLVTLTDVDQSSRLLESTDGARSFPTTLATSPPGRYLADLLISPADPAHVYVQALSLTDKVTWVLHSPDGGKTWDEHRFDYPAFFEITLAAADPVLPETLYAVARVPDVLLRSQDGGTTFQAIYQGGPVLAVAVTRERIWAFDLANGLMRAAVGPTPVFEKVPGAPTASCLSVRGDQVIACAYYQIDRYVLGASSGGDAFQPILGWFSSVPGPIDCPAGSPSRTRCDPLWPQLAQSFSFVRADAGVPDAATTPTPAPRSSGCAVGGGDATPLAALLMASAASLMRRRRARRPRRAPPR